MDWEQFSAVDGVLFRLQGCGVGGGGKGVVGGRAVVVAAEAQSRGTEDHQRDRETDDVWRR